MERRSCLAGDRRHVQELTCSNASTTPGDSIYRRLAPVVGTAAACSHVAKGTSSGKENSVEKDVFSTPLIEESRVGGAASTYQRMKGDGGEHRAEEGNAPEKLQCASGAFLHAVQCTNITENSDPVGAAAYSRGSDGRCPRHIEPTEAVAAVHPSVSGEGANESGGGAANTSATATERQVEVSLGAAVGTAGASPVAEKRKPVFCAAKMSKGPVSALDLEGRPTVLSSITSTTPAKDSNEGSGTSSLSTAELTSQDLVHERATQQFPQDSAAEIRGKCLRGSVEKKHLSVDVHGSRSQQHISYQGQLIEPEKTRSDECGTANSLSVDEKVKRNEKTVTPGSYASVCPSGKESNSGLRDDAQILSVDPADGKRNQSRRTEAKAHDRGNLSIEFPTTQLQQSRYDAADSVPASCRAVEGRLFQEIEGINGDNSVDSSSRLGELRQFTLELLYAVSLLRPLARRGSSRCDLADTFNSQGEPAADPRERVDVFTSAQLFRRTKYTHEELEKRQTAASCATDAESQDASEGDTIKCNYQQLRASIPAKVPLRRSQRCSSFGDVAALKRRVTEAVLLCKVEETSDGIFTATERNGKRHAVEGDEIGLSEERRAGDLAADAALAAVASATGRSQHGSFETLAEKIGAAKTIKEVAVYLCGCFGPLLHLLQEHMNQNRLQPLHKPKAESGSKSTGISTGDFGISEIAAQELARGRRISLHRERSVLRGTHVDETVGGVNAVLQVLMEVDQSAADSILDSVCKRLFSSRPDQGRPSSSPLHSPTAFTRVLRESELVRQIEEGKTWNQGQQQRKNELTPAECPPLSNADVTCSDAAYSGRPDGKRRPFAGGDWCERRGDRHPRPLEDEKGTVHQKTVEMCSALSPFPAADDEQNIGTRKNEEDLQAENGVCGNVQVGDQTQVSNGDITFSAGRIVEALSGDVSCLDAGEKHVESVASSSSSVTVATAVHPHHDAENGDAAESLLGSYRASGTEGDIMQAPKFPLLRQQHQQKMLYREEGEGHINVHGGSTECDESLARRTAWLATQLSTPLDFLGGDSMRETSGDKNEKASEEVMHILETLEAAVLQPPASSLTNLSATAANEKELLMESSEEPHAWETGVQLVLRMLREQEEQLSASEPAAAPTEGHISSRERHPKRRAVLDESKPEQGAHHKVSAAKNQLRSSMWGVRRDGDEAEERSERTVAPHRISPVELASSAGRGMVARDYVAPSGTSQETRAATADQAATFRRIAAAAAVERAATAVAQQGAAAAVEHARVGSAELMDKMCDLEGPPVAELPGAPSVPTTQLAASTCQALRRAVEYVEPSKNDEENVQEDAIDMFADLDDGGLDSLVSQLLKIAERPIEQQRRQENRKEQLMGLMRDMQGPRQQEYRHGSEHDVGHSRPPHLRRAHQSEAYQPYPQQHAQWKETAEDQVMRRGSSGDGTDVTRHSFFQRETSARRTNPDLLENFSTSDRARVLGDPRTEAVSSYLRTTEILRREEKLLPPRVPPALLNPFEISTISEWHLRRPSASSADRRLSLNPPGSTGNATPSPADSPLIPRCGRYMLDTPTQSDARSFGPSQRQSNMKRSPWRSCEPYSSSASTMVASPLAASAKPFGSSSLTSSPFSLLPTSATAAMQPFGVTPDSRLETAGNATPSGRSTGDTLVRGGCMGRVEVLPADSSALLRDSRSHRNSSRRAESRQRRFSAGAENLPFGLLPARVSDADCSSTLSVYSSIATSKRTTGLKTTPGESVTGVEGGHYRDIAADSLHAQLRALDFFDISASARAHLLAEAASPSVPILRALSSPAPTVPTTHEVNTLAGRRQGQAVARVLNTQPASCATAAQEESVKFLGSGAVPFSAFLREPENQGSPKGAASMKLEHSHMLSPRSFSSAVVRSTSKSGSSTAPAVVLQPSESSKSKLHEATRFTVDAASFSAGEQSRSERVDQQPGNTENWDCTARRTRRDRSTTTTMGRGNQEEHLNESVASVALGQSWTRANAGCSGRTGRQQQQIVLDGKDFWLKGNGPADRGDPRRARYAGGERQEEKSSDQHYESHTSSPVFIRSTQAGGRKEAAVAGCVGTGGADCLCGGALCLYRSAVSGVVYDKSGQKWTARWNEDGRQHKRTFAAAKYGFFTAKLKAEACRGEARERTARSKHEALQRQQESLVHRLGLFSTARSSGDQSYVCTEPRSIAHRCDTNAEEQKEVRP